MLYTARAGVHPPTARPANALQDRTRGPRFDLEFMVKRLTSEVADFFGFHDRARLEIGKKADINVDNIKIEIQPNEMKQEVDPNKVFEQQGGGAGSSDAGKKGVECAGWGDLSHTLQGSLSASVQGLVFDGLSGAALAAPVPEPASWGLLGLGMAGLAVRQPHRGAFEYDNLLCKLRIPFSRG